MTGTEPALLGIDLGTSQVKALLCGRGGGVLGTGIAGYRVQAPRPGWAETSPDDWWRATGDAVKDAENWWINSGSHSFGLTEFQAFASPIPEPMTMSLLALGGLALLRRRRN